MKSGTPNSGKKKVEVSLLGQRFTLRSEESEEYVHALAQFVGQQLEEIRKQSKTISIHHLTLLVSLNLADRFFQQQEEIRILKEEIKKQAQDALLQVKSALSLFPDSCQTASPSMADEEKAAAG